MAEQLPDNLKTISIDKLPEEPVYTLHYEIAEERPWLSAPFLRGEFVKVSREVAQELYLLALETGRVFSVANYCDGTLIEVTIAD